jgi:GTP-binding protein LepA
MGLYKHTEISVVKMALNGEEIESLSYLVHKTKAYKFAKSQCLKLKSVIPNELFPINIQGIVGNKIIARETYIHE